MDGGRGKGSKEGKEGRVGLKDKVKNIREREGCLEK